MVTLSELELLLNLNGNMRIPYLEAEIFADTALTYFYLTKMAEYLESEANQQWVNKPVSSWEEASWVVYWYSRQFLPFGWAEAERVMCDDTYWCKLYWSELS